MYNFYILPGLYSGVTHFMQSWAKRMQWGRRGSLKSPNKIFEAFYSITTNSAGMARYANYLLMVYPVAWNVTTPSV